MASIVLIGSGNLATCLGKAMLQAGMEIRGVYSRNFSHAAELSKTLETIAGDDLTTVPEGADFYLIAVKDAAIAEVSAQLDVRGTVVHCSGMSAIDLLGKHAHHGVLWPVQTFTKNIQPDFNRIPFCVEGNNTQSSDSIAALARTISQQVVPMSSLQRRYVHLAAVFANNFSNHLFHTAADLLQQHDLPFDLVRPLIMETARKVQQSDPREVQTGPAIRNDQPTMDAHLRMLDGQPEWRQLYALLSAAIGKENR